MILCSENIENFSPSESLLNGFVKNSTNKINLFNDDKLGLIIVEILLYISLAGRIFANQLGFLNFIGLSGAIIVSSGLICLVIILCQSYPIPASILFVLLINSFASITDLYHIGLFARDMIYWMSVLLMVCYIVRDFNAALRFQLFLATTVVISVIIGGVSIGQANGYVRLALHGVGSMFSNSNDLAQISFMTAIALLFSSLRVKNIVKIICYIFAIILSAIVLSTLSRQGLLMLGIGFMFFILASTMEHGTKSGILIFSLMSMIALFIFDNEIKNIIDGYIYRLSLSSDRVAYWQTAPKDMIETLISGNGSLKPFSSTGLVPHSTFLWLHISYGGLCAFTYFAWIIWLTYKISSTILHNSLDLISKIELITMFILFFLCQFTTTFAPGNYGFILGIAIIERYFLKIEKTN